MRKKHRRSLFIMALAYLFLGTSVLVPQPVQATLSGNYTDLLPIGAAGDTMPYSRGSGYGAVTVPPASTMGDGISKLSFTIFQSTTAVAVASSVAQTTFTAISGQGSIGYATIPAAWATSGRSIRVTAYGKYGTQVPSSTWTWDLILGTTTVLSTGAMTVVASQTSQTFRATMIATIGAVGAGGSMNASFDIVASSGTAPFTTVNFSTSTASATSVDLTSQLTIRPRFTWSASSASNTITFTNVVIELLN